MKWPVVRVLGGMLLLLSLGEISLIAQSTLVSTGSVWRYLDTGTNEGTAWRGRTFDDSAWLSGPAQLGFSSGPAENDETTFLSRTNSLGEPTITFYFRHVFDVPDAYAYTNLMVRLQRDDGAVVYLNGVEVFRSNMAAGDVNFATLAMLAQDDGTAVYAGPVDPNLLIAGNNVLAVEVHQNSPTSSDASFELELLGNVVFQRPTVAITSPATGSVIGSPTVVLAAVAADADGVISMVEFLEGETVLGVVTNAPFTLTLLDTLPGEHVFTAVAVDSTGLSATSAPVVVTVLPALVASRAEWRYLDDGSQPAASWVTAAFDDSGWSNGVAQFGFGEGDETTLIRRFSDLTGTNIITHYFRHTFSVPDPASITTLAVRLLRDDGGIVYLNGTEIFRNNLPAGPVDSSTLALLIAEDSEFRAVRVDRQLLLAGQNVIAVEVHQINLTSSDVSFDLELLPNIAPRHPSVSIESPDSDDVFVGPVNITANAVATDADDAIASVAFYLDGYLAGTVNAEPYSLLLENLLGNHTLLAVATDSLGLSSTSAPVNIGIAGFVSLISTGSVWKYLDTGIDQGTNWRLVSFDDSAWSAGPAKLGTNDAPSTVIRICSANGLPVRTSYYRHHFEVGSLASITNLAFRVLRDDGCLAYLNGVEIFRMNMPTGTVTFNTVASAAVAGNDEYKYYSTNISAALLGAGANVLAVELHQTSGTSDAGFDLSLNGITIPPVNVPPLIVEHVGDGVRISWSGTGFILQEATEPGGPYSNRPAISSPYLISAPIGNRFYRLARP